MIIYINLRITDAIYYTVVFYSPYFSTALYNFAAVNVKNVLIMGFNKDLILLFSF